MALPAGCSLSFAANMRHRNEKIITDSPMIITFRADGVIKSRSPPIHLIGVEIRARRCRPSHIASNAINVENLVLIEVPD